MIMKAALEASFKELSIFDGFVSAINEKKS